MRDLYAKKDLGLFSSNFSAVVPFHGVLALKLTPSKYVQSFDQWRPWDCGVETDTGEHGVWACFSEPCLFVSGCCVHALCPRLRSQWSWAHSGCLGHRSLVIHMRHLPAPRFLCDAMMGAWSGRCA